MDLIKAFNIILFFLLCNISFAQKPQIEYKLKDMSTISISQETKLKKIKTKKTLSNFQNLRDSQKKIRLDKESKKYQFLLKKDSIKFLRSKKIKMLINQNKKN